MKFDFVTGTITPRGTGLSADRRFIVKDLRHNKTIWSLTTDHKEYRDQMYILENIPIVGTSHE